MVCNVTSTCAVRDLVASLVYRVLLTYSRLLTSAEVSVLLTELEASLSEVKEESLEESDSVPRTAPGVVDIYHSLNSAKASREKQ